MKVDPEGATDEAGAIPDSVDALWEREKMKRRKESNQDRCLSRLIIRDLSSRFREWVDQRSWLKVRLAVS